MQRDWFWQLSETRQGPDWSFYAVFAPADAERVAAYIRSHALPGFAYYHVRDGACRQHGHLSSYDLYVDQRNYQDLVANITGETQRNIWIYHTIEICGADLLIERGYAGYPHEHGATETSLIATLAQAPDLTWVTWEVCYSGDGYPAGAIARGTTPAQLLAYLQE